MTELQAKNTELAAEVSAFQMEIAALKEANNMTAEREKEDARLLKVLVSDDAQHMEEIDSLKYDITRILSGTMTNPISVVIPAQTR